ncbi:MAG: hypothetical protein COT91_01190 [Candidatus Doudnabacteria bacterium CG10_big_fil_rev_8_21_14_0_10_41_10]|uniref:histidine kinase n=1 Tax=Candidatus Doudnabacteria bacterium CG10_big_fil_rev_8_21_14_0_10_41_10 TaxID=1974551 RepID=A0A2H0VEF3_9BACT|nr:MAG: hypothetical protein COT91_01190 [Candidatus Doudnabacteria bacterium CG10_big_fil_rev_8_21_14_0_10_41_10]
MEIFANLDLFTVGLTVTGIGVLGFLVWLTNRRSITNRTFFAFSVITVSWGIINYLNYQTASPMDTLWLLRIVLFFAVLQAFTLFQFIYVFPLEQGNFSKAYKYGLVPLVIFTAILTLTPAVLKEVLEISSTGGATRVRNGVGIGLFGLVSVGLVLDGLLTLYKKIRIAVGVQKSQLKTIAYGVSITFALIIFFNFFLPAFLDNALFIPFGAVFILPLILFTYHAIIQHHFLNVKVITVEVLIMVLAVTSFLDVLISESLIEVLIRVVTFILVLVIGVLLIKGVLKEIKQKNELQVLSIKLKSANEKLKELDQARAEFISVVSHQLRTPPATLKWYLAALLSGDFGKVTAEQLDALQKANITNNNLISLIEDMLNVSRIERGRMEFDFVKGDLNKLIESVIVQLKPPADDKKIGLVYKKPKKSLPEVVMDGEKVKQVVNNLIDNAIKYSKSGSITIELSQTNEQAKVRVTDTGKGIDQKELENIFSKYGRGKDSKKYATGLGLGLYVAKIVIEQHEGKIWVESPGRGKGSTFAFTLPMKVGARAEKKVFNMAQKSNLTKKQPSG